MAEIKLGIYKLVDDAIEREANDQTPRNYMGASGLGEECSRKLWYSFHQPVPITDPRVNRIFRLGDAIEDLVIDLLRKAGMTVYTEHENGEQFGFVDGKVAGHIDGVIIGLPESSKPHLLEVKSAKSTRWTKFVKDGYKSDKKYWTQIQIYMLKMELENGLVVIYNKDTSELYFERIKLDKNYAKRAISKGKSLADMTDTVPMRKYSKPTYYLCKWCDYNQRCWEGYENEG